MWMQGLLPNYKPTMFDRHFLVEREAMMLGYVPSE